MHSSTKVARCITTSLSWPRMTSEIQVPQLFNQTKVICSLLEITHVSSLQKPHVSYQACWITTQKSKPIPGKSVHPPNFDQGSVASCGLWPVTTISLSLSNAVSLRTACSQSSPLHPHRALCAFSPCAMATKRDRFAEVMGILRVERKKLPRVPREATRHLNLPLSLR